MSLDAGGTGTPSRSHYDWHDVRFIGAVAGRYAMPDRKDGAEGKPQVFACRLCSISTRAAVLVGPVVGKKGEPITAHFDEFGILRGRVGRHLPSGFVAELVLSPGERDKLGGKIIWQKKRVYDQLPDRREHKRILPREPRTIITLGDGARVPCFVIDVSPTGIAVSAQITPEIGTPMAVGKLVGRVVRYLDIGFALQFLAPQPPDQLEILITPPAV